MMKTSGLYNSFEVLHLLARFLDFRLHRQSHFGDLQRFPARPEVFESSVLASRFISCSRKSSFLPISPPCVEQSEEMLDVGIQADEFFLNVAAIDQQRGFLQQALRVDVRAQQFLQRDFSLST